MKRPPLSLGVWARCLGLAVFCTLVWSAVPASAQILAQQRTWTDSSGTYTVEATILSVEDGKVMLLRADGRRVAVPLDKLSKADQDFVRAAMAAGAGQAAGAHKLPFDPTWVSDDFQAAVLARPNRIFKSEVIQSLMKTPLLRGDTRVAGVDLAEIDWVIVLVAPASEVGAGGTGNAFPAPTDDAPPAAKVGVIVVSQNPFDRNRMKASAEFRGATERMVDGKVQWTVPTPAGAATDFLFYSENILLASAHGMVSKMLTANGSEQQVLRALQQVELDHDATVVMLAPPPIQEGADSENGSNPINRIAQTMEYGMVYLDVGSAPKLAAKVATSGAQQAQELKQQADAGMGLVKLMATLGLQEQLKDLDVDPAPLTSLITDTLNTFQSSVDGNAVSFSVATPEDTAQRLQQCIPIVQAIMIQQRQRAGATTDTPFGPGGTDGTLPNRGGIRINPENGLPLEQP